MYPIQNISKKSIIPIWGIILILLMLGGNISFLITQTSSKKETNLVISNQDCATIPFFSSQPTNNLVGIWSFEESMLWSDGSYKWVGYNNLDGFSSINNLSPGKFGNAISFSSGSADSITINDNNLLDITLYYSWSAWVYPTEANYPDAGALIWKNDEYGLRILTTGFFQAFIYDSISSSWRNVDSPLAYPINTWYHVMAVRSDNILKLFVNGEKMGEISNIQGTTQTGNALFIGSQGTQNSFEFTGKVDDARIYNRSVSDNEVKAIMQNEMYYSNLADDPDFSEGIATNFNTAGSNEAYRINTISGSNWILGIRTDDGDKDYANYRPNGSNMLNLSLYSHTDSSSFDTDEVADFYQQLGGGKYYANPFATDIRIVTGDTYARKEIATQLRITNYLQVGNSSIVNCNPHADFYLLEQQLSATPGDWHLKFAYSSWTFSENGNLDNNYLIDSYVRFGIHTIDDGGYYSGNGLRVSRWEVTYSYVGAYALWVPNQNPILIPLNSSHIEIPYQTTKTLSWFPYDSCSNSGTCYYSISLNSTPIVSNQIWNSGTIISYQIENNLATTPGTYNYELTLSDGLGGISFHIYQVNITRPPNPPILNTITPNPNPTGDIQLTWNSVSGATLYKIYRSTSPITNELSLTPIETTILPSYKDVGRSNGTYYYAIRATNASGDSDIYNYRSVTVAIPPPSQYAPPPPLFIIHGPNPSSTGVIDLQWDLVIGASSYKIYRDTNPISTIGSLIPLATTISKSFRDTVPYIGKYYYAVTAVNSSGESIRLGQSVEVNYFNGLDMKHTRSSSYEYYGIEEHFFDTATVSLLSTFFMNSSNNMDIIKNAQIETTEGFSIICGSILEVSGMLDFHRIRLSPEFLVNFWEAFEGSDGIHRLVVTYEIADSLRNLDATSANDLFQELLKLLIHCFTNPDVEFKISSSLEVFVKSGYLGDLFELTKDKLGNNQYRFSVQTAGKSDYDIINNVINIFNNWIRIRFTLLTPKNPEKYTISLTTGDMLDCISLIKDIVSYGVKSLKIMAGLLVDTGPLLCTGYRIIYNIFHKPPVILEKFFRNHFTNYQNIQNFFNYFQEITDALYIVASYLDPPGSRLYTSIYDNSGNLLLGFNPITNESIAQNEYGYIIGDENGEFIYVNSSRVSEFIVKVINYAWDESIAIPLDYDITLSDSNNSYVKLSGMLKSNTNNSLPIQLINNKIVTQSLQGFISKINQKEIILEILSDEDYLVDVNSVIVYRNQTELDVKIQRIQEGIYKIVPKEDTWQEYDLLYIAVIKNGFTPQMFRLIVIFESDVENNSWWIYLLVFGGGIGATIVVMGLLNKKNRSNFEGKFPVKDPHFRIKHKIHTSDGNVVTTSPNVQEIVDVKKLSTVEENSQIEPLNDDRRKCPHCGFEFPPGWVIKKCPACENTVEF